MKGGAVRHSRPALYIGYHKCSSNGRFDSSRPPYLDGAAWDAYYVAIYR